MEEGLEGGLEEGVGVEEVFPGEGQQVEEDGDRLEEQVGEGSGRLEEEVGVEEGSSGGGQHTGGCF